MWSDRDDDDELPPEPPGPSFALVIALYAACLLGLAVMLALLYGHRF